MLELQDISLVYNPRSASEIIALRSLELSVPSGQFLTVVGTNGAGKSSLIQVISGAVRPSKGRILMDGHDVTGASEHTRAARIARVFDNPHAGTLPGLSIEENMALATDRGRRRGLRLAVTSHRRARMREALEVLDLGLENRLADSVTMLSTGQRQSLTVVMASLRRPDVLLLDEHVAALDPGTQRTVLGLTVRLIEAMKCTAVMVTHNMEHAISLGNRLIVMSRGSVIADYSGDEKKRLTVPRLVEDITRRGSMISDRSALVEAPSSDSAAP